MNTAAMRSFSRCHPNYLVCSKYVGVLIIYCKIFYYLANIMFKAYSTSRHINTIVCTCQVLIVRNMRGQHLQSTKDLSLDSMIQRIGPVVS